MCDRGNCLSDRTISNQPNRFACQFHQWCLPIRKIFAGLPVALMHGTIMVSHLIRHFQQQSKGRLCHCIGTVARNIGHGDSLFLRCCQINDIVSSCQDPNVGQLRTCFEHICGDRRFICQNCFGIADSLNNFLFICIRGTIIHRHLS